MVINIFYLIAIVGLLCIIVGTLMISMNKKMSNRYVYFLFIVGGICLEIYSIYIKDLIFIVLQAIFIVSAIYGLIKSREKKNEI